MLLVGIFPGCVFAWLNVQAVRIVSSSVSRCSLWDFGVSSGCSCGAFGWISEAPLLHHPVFQAFSAMAQAQVGSGLTTEFVWQ